jgi:hypothetical protein
MSGWFNRCAMTLVFLVAAGWAQTSGRRGASNPPGYSTDQWSLAAYAYGYVAPNELSYFCPIFYADRRWLHLEARYNYEDQQTGSLWAGYDFKFGSKVAFQATPMFGAIFGNTTGVAPGYEVSLTYKRLYFYSEGEYVFDFKNKTGDFFYTWDELDYYFKTWLHAGLAEQRTLAYQTPQDTRIGISAGFTRGKIDFTAYLFNIGGSDPTAVMGLGYKF